MSRTIALACVTVFASFGASCGASGERTQAVLFPDMMESVPYDAYDAPRLPPKGTIPVSFHEFAYGSEEEDAIRAGEELMNPFSSTPETLSRGKEVYETMCLVCHGVRGDGDGPIIGRFPNPPSLLVDHARGYPDGRIFHVITRGQGIMPSHSIQVRPDDRWRVVVYLRQLQQPVGAP